MVRPMQRLEEEQRRTCASLGSDFIASLPDSVCGVGRGFDSSQHPIHGLRHPPAAQSCGWYLWTGEYRDDDNFFEPMHVTHLIETCPPVLCYLGLAPGWRFLLAPDHTDIWCDQSLLVTLTGQATAGRIVNFPER
jgi:hypothetical protein